MPRKCPANWSVNFMCVIFSAAPPPSENDGQQRDIFWPVGPLYGELRHLELKLDAKASEFRKPYLQSGRPDSSKAAYSCNAKLMVSF